MPVLMDWSFSTTPPHSHGARAQQQCWRSPDSRKKQQQQHGSHMNQQVSICLQNCSADTCLPSGILPLCSCKRVVTWEAPSWKGRVRCHLPFVLQPCGLPLAGATSGTVISGILVSLCSHRVVRFSSLVSSSYLLFSTPACWHPVC